ncbi:MAG TPA: helix-turn-helix domain-containing protein [Candidatus Limnocylindrales bacterium]|nr:helix-turn-helix domain-containing protein [Candidatus Limnocylindrales bacterium]
MSIRGVFGTACQGTRVALDLTQQQLADAVGIHRGHLANIEAGRANLSIDLMERIADRLGQRLDLTVEPPRFIAPRRPHDTVHAWCSGYVTRHFHAVGWVTAREVDVSAGNVHGWIDLFAFEPGTGTLVIVEIKTRVDDLGGIERQVGWYERQAARAARQLGWRPRRIVVWLIVLASDEVEQILVTSRDLIDQAFPGRAAAILATLGGASPVATRSIAMVDPASRRSRWLIPTGLDRRRASLPYRDYGDAARRIPVRRRR